MTLKGITISNNNNTNLPFILSLTLFLEGTVFFPPSRTPPCTKKDPSHSLSPGLSMNDQYNLHFHLTACSQDASTQPHISTSVTYAQPSSHLPQSPWSHMDVCVLWTWGLYQLYETTVSTARVSRRTQPHALQSISEAPGRLIWSTANFMGNFSSVSHLSEFRDAQTPTERQPINL